MKYLYLLALVAILALPLTSLAQGNYKPGYMVSLKGDTTKGYVDYKEWITSPHDFNFKTDVNAKAESYSVDNCSAFGITGIDYYRRYTTSISQDKIQLSQLTIGPDKDTVMATVFMRILTSGKNLTLLVYSDAIKTRYYMAETNAPAVELIRSLYFDPANSSTVVTQNTYARQLQHMAAKYQPGDEQLLLKTSEVSYFESDLERTVNKINGSEVNAGLHPSARSGVRFFAGIGLNNTFSKYDDYQANKATSSSSYPQASIGTDIFINKNSGSLLIRLNLGVTAGKSSFTYDEGLANTTSTNVLKYNQTNGFFDALLQYNFYKTTSTQVYAGAGWHINYASYSNKSYITTYHITSTDSETAAADFPSLKSSYANITGRVGVVINNMFDIYAEYDLPTDLSDATGYTLKQTDVKAGINFLFGK